MFKLRCKNALVAATTTQLFCLPDFNEPQTQEDRSQSKNFISHDYFNQVIFTLFLFVLALLEGFIIACLCSNISTTFT